MDSFLSQEAKLMKSDTLKPYESRSNNSMLSTSSRGLNKSVISHSDKNG